MTKRNSNIPKIYKHGIEIVKPWSSAMYNHNDLVADLARIEVENRFREAIVEFQNQYDSREEAMEVDWSDASDEMKNIQNAITCYGFGMGYTIEKVIDTVYDELDIAPLFMMKEIVEDLELELELGFVGFESAEEIKELRQKFA